MKNQALRTAVKAAIGLLSWYVVGALMLFGCVASFVHFGWFGGALAFVTIVLVGAACLLLLEKWCTLDKSAPSVVLNDSSQESRMGQPVPQPSKIERRETRAILRPDRTFKGTSPPVVSLHTAQAPPPTQSDDGFALSLAVAAATDNPIAGMLIGGNPLGALVGMELAEASRRTETVSLPVDPGYPSIPACDVTLGSWDSSSSGSSSSYDSGSSFDSSSCSSDSSGW